VKFYILRDENGSVIGCEVSKTRAVKRAKADPFAADVWLVVIDMPPREAIRVLLEDRGGYAAEQWTVWERPAAADEGDDA